MGKNKMKRTAAPSTRDTKRKKVEHMNNKNDDINDNDLQNSDNNGTFKDLGLIPELCEACEKLGYKTPTDIQKQAIPLALQNKDIIGLAETGSGKTAAFALPALQHLAENPQRLHTVVLAPTRELAVQIHDNFQALGSIIRVKVCTIIGGVDRTSQAIALANKPHVVVASPGRLVDHLENTKGFH
eukprot:UN30012